MSFTTVLLVSVVLAPTLVAQIPGVTSPSSPAPQEQSADPLGRTTPRGTISAFTRAVQREDYMLAGRYLQVTESQRRTTETLARNLKDLMDRYFSQAVTSISDSPDGTLDDGLPIDRERVGPLTVGATQADITLVRVTDPQSGRVWLISSETLARVPTLHASIARTWIERVMPTALVSRELLGISLAQWVVLTASIVIPLVLLSLLSSAFVLVARRLFSNPARRHDLDEWYAAIRWPAIAVLTLLVHAAVMRYLGFPLAFRIAYARVELVAAVVVVTWLLRRILKLGFARARSMVWGRDSTSTRSLMLLGERLIQALLAVVAVIAILTIVGVNTNSPVPDDLRMAPGGR